MLNWPRQFKYNVELAPQFEHSHINSILIFFTRNLSTVQMNIDRVLYEKNDPRIDYKIFDLLNKQIISKNYQDLSEFAKTRFRQLVYLDDFADDKLECTKDEFMELYEFTKKIKYDFPPRVSSKVMQYLFNARSDQKFMIDTVELHKSTIYLFQLHCRDFEMMYHTYDAKKYMYLLGIDCGTDNKIREKDVRDVLELAEHKNPLAIFCSGLLCYLYEDRWQKWAADSKIPHAISDVSAVGKMYEVEAKNNNLCAIQYAFDLAKTDVNRAHEIIREIYKKNKSNYFMCSTIHEQYIRFLYKNAYVLNKNRANEYVRYTYSACINTWERGYSLYALYILLELEMYKYYAYASRDTVKRMLNKEKMLSLINLGIKEKYGNIQYLFARNYHNGMQYLDINCDINKALELYLENWNLTKKFKSVTHAIHILSQSDHQFDNVEIASVLFGEIYAEYKADNPRSYECVYLLSDLMCSYDVLENHKDAQNIYWANWEENQDHKSYVRYLRLKAIEQGFSGEVCDRIFAYIYSYEDYITERDHDIPDEFMVPIGAAGESAGESEESE